MRKGAGLRPVIITYAEQTKDDNKSRASDRSSQYDDKRIVITDKRINKVIFNHFPALVTVASVPATATAKTGATSSIWTVRTITPWYSTCQLQVPPTSMDARRIKVNNWVLNLQNADLGK